MGQRSKREQFAKDLPAGVMMGGLVGALGGAIGVFVGALVAAITVAILIIVFDRRTEDIELRIGWTITINNKKCGADRISGRGTCTRDDHPPCSYEDCDRTSSCYGNGKGLMQSWLGIEAGSEDYPICEWHFFWQGNKEQALEDKYKKLVWLVLMGGDEEAAEDAYHIF